jgi:hypothetical protein
MPGMYPDDQFVEIFGERVKYPGLDTDTHKFTDGDFADPLKKPSYIPAATFNLLLDNMENLIRAMGLEPNNTDPEQLREAMLQGFAPRSVGEYHFLSYMPSVIELVRLRYLPLDYRIIKISLYEELCDLKWVGEEANNTARFWYKCSEEGTRNINGQYMRVEDARGMFYRGAGANAVLRTDMNNPLSAPYDGFNIGTPVGDAIREINGSATPTVFPGASRIIMEEVTGAFYTLNNFGQAVVSDNTTANLPPQPSGIGFQASRSSNVIVAHENRPASISALICISY